MSVPSFEEWELSPASNKPFRGFVKDWSMVRGGFYGRIHGKDALNGQIWSAFDEPSRLGALYAVISDTVVETKNFHYILLGPGRVNHV